MIETTTAAGAPAPAALAIVEPYQRPALTPRGTAAARLSAFQDCWDQLAAADRAWFAEWLRDLLVDAVMGAPAPTA